MLHHLCDIINMSYISNSSVTSCIQTFQMQPKNELCNCIFIYQLFALLTDIQKPCCKQNSPHQPSIYKTKRLSSTACTDAGPKTVASQNRNKTAAFKRTKFKL